MKKAALRSRIDHAIRALATYPADLFGNISSARGVYIDSAWRNFIRMGAHSLPSERFTSAHRRVNR
jgi:hypothetical protein